MSKKNKVQSLFEILKSEVLMCKNKIILTPSAQTHLTIVHQSVEDTLQRYED